MLATWLGGVVGVAIGFDKHRRSGSGSQQGSLEWLGLLVRAASGVGVNGGVGWLVARVYGLGGCGC